MQNMFPNLVAEMARKGLKRKDLAPLFKGRNATVSDKLNGKSPFLLDEAYRIQSTFFPDCTLDYLFARNDQQKTTPDVDVGRSVS